MSLLPTKQQIDALRSGPKDSPIVMINMLVYKNRDSYKKYMHAIGNLMPDYGAKLVWMGEMVTPVIGENVPPFETVFLVQYPNQQAFLDMTSSDAYLADKIHREEGLKSQWLIATTPLPEFIQGKSQE